MEAFLDEWGVSIAAGLMMGGVLFVVIMTISIINYIIFSLYKLTRKLWQKKYRYGRDIQKSTARLSFHLRF